MSQSPKHTHRVVRKAELAKFRSDMTTFEQAYEDVGNRLDTASKKLVRDMLAVTESELAAVKSNASV